MFTRDNIWIFLAMAVFLLTPISIWYMVDGNTDKCDQQGGVLVNTPTGWKCIEAKELK